MIKLQNDTNMIAFDNDAYILTEKDFGFADLTAATVQNIGQTGVKWMGNAIGARHISIEGWIIAENAIDMNQKKTIFLNIISP